MSNNRVCIGGFSCQENRYIRLLNENGYPHDNTISFKIGEIYEIRYQPRQEIDLPHSEDILVKSFKLKSKLATEDFLQFIGNLAVNITHITNLFNDGIEWDNQHGYLPFSTNLPCKYSVIIARLGHNLYRSKIDEQYFYYKDPDRSLTFQVKYVGENDISGIKIIKADTPIRFSLARWWDGGGRYNPKRSYLQLSGFYN